MGICPSKAVVLVGLSVADTMDGPFLFISFLSCLLSCRGGFFFVDLVGDFP